MNKVNAERINRKLSEPVSDMTFFTDITQESFPIFLLVTDRFIDEEETARKLLK